MVDEEPDEARDEERIEAVLDVWFGPLGDHATLPDEARRARWFRKDPAFDRMLETRFGDLVRSAEVGGLDGWRRTPRGALALVLVCDQLPRNLYRDDPRAWGLDRRAQALARDLIDSGDERALHPVERTFVRMPLMHAEDRALAERSVAELGRLRDETSGPVRGLLEAFCRSAEHHASIVRRFGRYPHRNRVLGRTSTPEEEAFLKEPGSSF